MIRDTSLKMCSDASVIGVHTQQTELAVTARKDWKTTMKGVVITGESRTAQRDGNWGRMGW